MKYIKLLSVLIFACLPSFIKVAYFRLRGMRIGKGAKIGIFSVVWVDRLSLGLNAKISSFSFVHCRKLTLGNRAVIKSLVAIDTVEVKIGHDSIIMEQVVIGGMKTPRSALFVGERVKIFSYSFLNPTEPIIIENDVGVGGANYIFTHGSWQSVLDGYPVAFGPVTIRQGVWLPWRVFILPNVEIGELCTIGANSVVNKSIPPRSLAAGSPAKIISADGAYVKVRSKPEKIQQLYDILDEMFEFFRFEGDILEVVKTLDGVTAEVEPASRQKQIIVFTVDKSSSYSLSSNTLLISFDPLDAATKTKAEDVGASWFEIENKVCSPGRSRSFTRVKNYLSRYGVRFAYHNEVSI